MALTDDIDTQVELIKVVILYLNQLSKIVTRVSPFEHNILSGATSSTDVNDMAFCHFICYV